MSFKQLYTFFSHKTNPDCADLIMKLVWFSKNSSVTHEFETIIQKIGECIHQEGSVSIQDCAYHFLSIRNLKIHSPHLAKYSSLYQTNIAMSRLQGRVFDNFYTVDRPQQKKFWRYLCKSEKASLPWNLIRKLQKEWMVEDGPKRPLHIFMNYHPKLNFSRWNSHYEFQVLDLKWLG
jgi:hypothetical protein